MNYSKFDELLKISNNELSEMLVEAENELFQVKFKKATRQCIIPREIKNLKRRIALLKTLLTVRIQETGEIISE